MDQRPPSILNLTVNLLFHLFKMKRIGPVVKASEKCQVYSTQKKMMVFLQEGTLLSVKLLLIQSCKIVNLKQE